MRLSNQNSSRGEDRAQVVSYLLGPTRNSTIEMIRPLGVCNEATTFKRPASRDRLTYVVMANRPATCRKTDSRRFAPIANGSAIPARTSFNSYAHSPIGTADQTRNADRGTYDRT